MVKMPDRICDSDFKSSFLCFTEAGLNEDCHRYSMGFASGKFLTGGASDGEGTAGTAYCLGKSVLPEIAAGFLGTKNGAVWTAPVRGYFEHGSGSGYVCPLGWEWNSLHST